MEVSDEASTETAVARIACGDDRPCRRAHGERDRGRPGGEIEQGEGQEHRRPADRQGRTGAQRRQRDEREHRQHRQDREQHHRGERDRRRQHAGVDSWGRHLQQGDGQPRHL